MAGQKHLVKFFKGTLQQYNSIIPNDYTFYFVTDVDKVYLGSTQLSNKEIYEQIEYLNTQLGKKANIYARTKEEWELERDIIAQENTFYVYTDREVKTDEDGNKIYYPGIKVGDGSSYLIDLPYIDDTFWDHISNTDIHVTLAQKSFWNNKVRTEDAEIQNENLIFTVL